MTYIRNKGDRHTNEERDQAAELWVKYGSYRRVGREMGVPESTIRGWAQRPDWTETVAKIRSVVDEEKLAKWSANEDLALKVMEENLLLGEERLQKDGTIIRVKPSTQHAVIAAGISRDKLRVSRGQATNIVSHSDDYLEKLADHLRGLAGRVINSEPVLLTVDVEEIRE